MRKDRTKLQINRQLRRRPLLDQIRPHGLVAWLFPKEIQAALNRLITEESDEGAALAPEARQVRESELLGICSIKR